MFGILNLALVCAFCCMVRRLPARMVRLQLAVLSGLFRIHPLLRQQHCSDWPEYNWAEICKRMRLEEVRSLDKVCVCVCVCVCARV